MTSSHSDADCNVQAFVSPLCSPLSSSVLRFRCGEFSEATGSVQQNGTVDEAYITWNQNIK